MNILSFITSLLIVISFIGLVFKLGGNLINFLIFIAGIIFIADVLVNYKLR
ncbi:MAG: hypothetical protein LIR50_05400 [Bacillota bacterium]|nr:hypothetical protein [Bacillota bacterium]